MHRPSNAAGLLPRAARQQVRRAIHREIRHGVSSVDHTSHHRLTPAGRVLSRALATRLVGGRSRLDPRYIPYNDKPAESEHRLGQISIVLVAPFFRTMSRSGF